MQKINKTAFSGAICAIVIMALIVLGCGRFLGSKEETSGVDYTKTTENLPAYDPDKPPSPGAAALRMLAELDPNVAPLIDGVEAIERAAIKKTMADIELQFNGGRNTSKISSAARPTTPYPSARRPTTPTSVVSMFMFQSGQSDSSIGDSHSAAVVAILISGLSDLLTPYLKESGSLSKSKTEKTKDGTTTVSIEIGRGDDGSTKFGLGVKTETMKDGVAAKSELAAKIDGQRCPNAEGQLPFTINVRLGAESGSAAMTRDVTAMVRAVVNDDAQVVSKTMDLSQSTRQVKNGQQIYIETATTLTYVGKEATESNFRVIRHSSQATAENAQPLAGAGHTAAHQVAVTTLLNAEQVWLDGGCTQIEAKSPGTVATSSTTAIPVTVRHKFDGTEVPSKLDVVLKGEKSVDPTKIAKTAGTLTYIAPAEKNKSATIGLTATSRRGRATLDLDANTGGKSYRVAGVSNGVSFTGEICSLSKNFDVEAKFPGGSATTSFAPKNDTRGITRVLGGGGGCEHTGDGTYTVTLNEDGSGTLTWTTSDKITCPYFGNSKTSTFTLPLQPAPDLSCP